MLCIFDNTLEGQQTLSCGVVCDRLVYEIFQGDDPLLTIIGNNKKISSDRVINNFVLPTGEGPYAGGLFAPDSTYVIYLSS